MVTIRRPSAQILPSYLLALDRGWTPEADVDTAGAKELKESVLRDTAAFLASLWNPDAVGAPIRLENGSEVPRLSWVRHWIVDDDEYAGEINLRWQFGTSELPAYCLGHVGYAVVPWKRGYGYASQALKSLCPIARAWGLSWIDISMAHDNGASRTTAARAGARPVKTFNAGPEYGNVDAVLYRLELTSDV